MYRYRRTKRWGTRRFLMLGAGAVSALAVAPSLAAEDTAPSDAGQIQDVIVTAQRKPEFQRDVPVAVTSLNGPTLDALSSSGEDIRFLAARVPSLQIESSFGRTYPRFYIRGLGNSDYTYNAQQPVGVVTDDVVLENPIIKAFPVFDVKDVEVLRGPQGTLFGRNTPAGVVKIDTNKPSDLFAGYADLSYGTYNTVDFNGAVGGAIVPNLLDFRASILEDRRDDWVTNINPDTMYHKKLEGYSDTAARLQLLYKPTDTLQALFEVDGRTLDGTARLFRADIIQQGTNHLVPGFKVDEVDLNGDNYQDLGTLGTHLTIDDDLGPVTLTSVTAYEHGSVRSRGDVSGGNFVVPPPIGTDNVTGTGFPDETSDAIPGLDQITEELRVATNGDGPLFNQAGFFYFHEYLHIESFDYTPSGQVDIANHQQQATASFGLFDSAKYKLTDTLTVGAGLRFSNDAKRYTVQCTLACVTPAQPTATSDNSEVTFDTSATYTINPDVNIYGRIASGYLAPAFDGRNDLYNFSPATGQLSKAKAETTTSYEIGLKSALFDHRANLNVTAYAYTTDNMQLTAVGGASQASETLLLNAHQVIGEGVETEFEVKPIPPLFLTASASYNFTQIQDPNLEVGGCGGGCTVTSARDPVTGNYYLNHNPLPQAPRWIIDASATYTQPLENNTEIYASTDWSYRSSVDFFLYKAVEYDSQSLTIGNIRLGYVDKTRGFEVAFFVHNLLDEVRATGAIDFDNITGFVNDPRTLGVEGRYTF